jgi:membrane fusion protein (multidrug efflux system)
MRKLWINIIWLVVVIVVGFIVYALASSAPTSQVAEPPDLDKVPTRVYGRVEPEGGEVFVSAPVSRRVVSIEVSEGDVVSQGEVLVMLEQSVEAAAARAADARVRAATTAFELSRETRERNRVLFEKNGLSDYEFRQLRLQAELDSLNLAAARQEAQQARAQLGLLTLRAPVAGKVYKLDLRQGQTLTAGDNTSIILGAVGYQVRLYVEAFWLNRVPVGTELTVYEAETHEQVAVGRVLRRAPYVGTREIRTEDTRARLDAEFQEVILELVEADADLPLGLYVLAELEE